MQFSDVNVRVPWRRTGNGYFPYAALVDGRWWVLRINGFPDHPLWTLFVGETHRFDLDEALPAWGTLDRSIPALDARTALQALAPIRDLVVYGSEVGQPCDDLVCCGGRLR